MTQINFGRAFISDSLGFHIIFASLGIGLPLIISIFELLGIWKKNEDYLILAKKIAQGFLVLFAIGTVSGTLISFQLSLLWPKFMSIIGQVVSLPFMIEGFCFLLETLFVVLYFYGWDKFKNRFNHWLLSIPIIIFSAASGIAIVTANAWMNNPAGFNIINGEFKNIDPLKAMLNPATPTETMHVLFSSYLFSGLAVAAVMSYFLLKKKYVAILSKGLSVMMIFSLLMVFITIFIGDISARYVAEQEPVKLAAMEGLFITQKNAPETVGGFINENKKEVTGAITIPSGLSYLAFGDMSHEVKGLDQFDKSIWPPLYIHYSFDIMVSSGFIVLLCTVLYFFRKKLRLHKFINIFIIISAFLTLVSIESGWVTTEVGRQPYVIRGILKTNDAFTTSQSVAYFAVLFPILFILLVVIGVVSLIKIYKKYPLSKEDGNNSISNK